MEVRDEFVELPDRLPGGGSLRLHYRDWPRRRGRRAAPALVLLHGLASNARIWDLAAPTLARRFRVIAVDQRGHGLSDRPAAGYGFREVTDDLKALIESLELERPVVVGHSWGGNVALQLAADHPALVRGIALVDGGFLEISAIDGMTWEQTERLMAPPPLDGVRLDAFLASARSWPELGDLWNDEIKEIVLANFEITPERTIRPRLNRENHMKILRALWEQKPSELWERVSCPVLMIPAARERGDPRQQTWAESKRRAIETALARAPAATVSVMDDTIHDVPLHRPRELAEVLSAFAASVA